MMTACPRGHEYACGALAERRDEILAAQVQAENRNDVGAARLHTASRTSVIASCGDAAISAPTAASGAVASGDRSHTVVRSPAAGWCRSAVPRLALGLVSRHHMVWMIHRSRRWPLVDS
jgi:hypothetical protein